ncbi:UvrD-helicase domain-containing protein [Aestuariimicrobium ganziense]|uniref:UvrD-helicase domain-containing protein n=1 Tax=Aestuariimicrobium ganziense TaxID=2773677 RepID=UPI0019440230|nr:UvrD-helicase domain-containing protein [Aestuariimicrobium ganziense]
MTVRQFDAALITSAATTTVIEASAGTGKTTAIAGLTVRALAEGWCTVEQVMLVTFGNRASTELRSRLHARLVDAVELLADRRQPGDGIDHLIAGNGDERALRASRVATALRDVDRATIATTHGFCASMLAELGVLVDHDNREVFADDLDEIFEQVFRDCYLRQHADAAPSQFHVSKARAVAEFVVKRLEPLDGPEGVPAEHWALATAVRAGLEQRKRVLGVHGYDDMVTRLHRALQADLPATMFAEGDPVLRARQKLADRFRWVMIDEYQDTDSMQWEIAQAAFDGRSPLVLVGDPKQAIYAFRGADVQAYLRAVEGSDQVTLATNWRSGHTVVAAVAQLFGPRALGTGITLPTVGAHHDDRHLEGADGPMPVVQLRLVTGAEDRTMSDVEATRLITHDVVAEVTRLLAAEFVEPPFGSSGPQRARVHPGDIAILVRTNRRGDELKEALLEAGVQAVFSGAGSVFDTLAAKDWLRLLDAMEQPTTANIRRATLTAFFGHDVMTLSRLDDMAVADIAVTIKDVAGVITRHGVAAGFAELCEQRDVLRRVLGGQDGERVATDLRHISQLLHDHQRRTDCGVSALRAWLADRVDGGAGSEEGMRRLESDRGAVQIMTIHRSKGLDLPIVLVPEASTWTAPTRRRFEPVVTHDDQRRARIKLAPTKAEESAADQEAADEELRLLYVALTRAKYALRAWWAPSGLNTPRSPLHRALADLTTTAQSPPPIVALAEEPAARLLARWGGTLWQATRVVEPPAPARAALPDKMTPVPELRRFDREIDPHWRRTSYSALTSDVHDAVSAPGLHPAPRTQIDDEPDDLDELAADDGPPTPIRDDVQPEAGDRKVSPLASFPGGVQFGTLVHAVLEDLDPSVNDLDAELTRASVAALDQVPLPDVSATDLALGLREVVTSSLGSLSQGRALCDYPTTDRLPELVFELPMADDTRRAHSVADLAAAFTRHLDASDPLGDYGARLGATVAGDRLLAGWLTGSIDAVLRQRDGDTTRYLVLDYKTNRMPLPPDEVLTVQHYSAAAMAEAMMASHYPLQALLYSVALHRFLTLRVPGYDPDQHLGGVGYLFVRGMADDTVEQPLDMPWGVFTWHPPAALVLEASAILEGL